MPAFPKPRVIVSKCLGFAACRWNGAVASDAYAARLGPHAEFRPVCPEMEIGLGCPRDPIRVVEQKGARRLVQPATGRDVSDAMREFAARFLEGAGEVDGFLLKSRSPSCGIKDVKVYGGPRAEQPRGGGVGFFGEAVLERFPRLAVEDEGRLTNFRLREHFLTKLFGLAALREVRAAGRMRDLVAFHARYKGLLAAYHQTELRRLGRVVANHEHRPEAEVFAAYAEGFARALARPPRPTSVINVFMHALGHVGDRLAAAEKAFFLAALEKYRAGQAPLSALAMLVKAWAARFDAPNLSDQAYLDPYPEALVDLTDSGKGRGRGR